MLWRQPIGLLFRRKMKKVFLVFSALIVISLSVFAQEIKFRIDGKPYNKQIYDENNNQITNFKNRELIQDFYISPDNKKMLVYHRPDKAKAFLMTLYNGEGIRFEYRSYEDLSIVRVVSSYYSFEDVEGNILINPDSMMKKIVFYHYSDGTEIKTIDCIKELADKKIYAGWIQIYEVKKVGKQKYKFYIEGNLNIEGRQEEEFKTVIEIEIKCKL